MAYSSISILALLVLLIINYDLIKRNDDELKERYHKLYKYFLLGVIIYFITDALWGFLYDARLIRAVYIDTVLYSLAMTATVFLWTRYVINYLGKRTIYIKAFSCFGWLYLIFDCTALIINFFVPIKFYFDEQGVYHANIIRYIALFLQILMFFITSIYGFINAAKTSGSERLRYVTIGTFGIALTLFIVAQSFYPLLPLYSIGYLLGTCLVHTFVLEDEKEDYRRELEFFINREQLQKKELGSTRKLAYTDSLTGVKNKRAFTEAEKEIQEAVNCGLINEFGVIVFDLNGLKIINDTRGHDAGDKYIQDSSQIICNVFKHSPVYRIGGDEFVVYLRGEDYNNREDLINLFDNMMDENLLKNDIVIASGIDVFCSAKGDSFISVFERADKKMYERKKNLKQKLKE